MTTEAGASRGQQPVEQEEGRSPVSAVVGSRPVRTYLHYSGHRGNVLAGGISFIALFSLASLLVVAVTAAGLVFAGSPDLQDSLYGAVNDQIPGLLVTQSTPDATLDPDAFLRSNVLSVTGAVAILAALFSALAWLDALREGIRAQFEAPPDTRPIVGKKLKDLFVLATLGVAVLVSAIASPLLNAAAGPLLRLVGLEGSTLGSLVLRVATVLVVLAIDTGVFLVLFRILPGLRLPWRELRSGALFGGIGLGLVKLTGGLLLRLAGGGNPIVSAVGGIAIILVYLNLLARIALLAAAWAATAAEQSGALVLARPLRTPRENLDVPAGPRVRSAVSFGQRSTDRTTLAAGAVLGALAVTGVRAGTGAVRAGAGMLRRFGRADD